MAIIKLATDTGSTIATASQEHTLNCRRMSTLSLKIILDTYIAIAFFT